jgi:hypothetical protein
LREHSNILGMQMVRYSPNNPQFNLVAPEQLIGGFDKFHQVHLLGQPQGTANVNARPGVLEVIVRGWAGTPVLSWNEQNALRQVAETVTILGG